MTITKMIKRSLQKVDRGKTRVSPTFEDEGSYSNSHGTVLGGLFTLIMAASSLTYLVFGVISMVTFEKDVVSVSSI